jgi:GDP-4-dehydro-6-deoxy-D-mannose reductase
VNGGRLLVTGARGFVGRHVESECSDGGAFNGWSFHASPRGLDLRDRNGLCDWVAGVQPDAVLHLAAQSFVPRSFEDPGETFQVNLLGTLNLLEMLRAAGFSGRFLYVSTGDVYGLVPDDALPVGEDRTPQPRNPYAVSKWAAEELCRQWGRTEGLDCMIARPFNHVGPGQDARFVLPALASQVVRIADGLAPPVITAGDVDVTRDFTDVRDIVKAYGLMLEHGLPGSTYVVGSGKERSVRELLRDMCRIEQIDVDVVTDDRLMRKAEQRRMVANPTLLRSGVGWEARIPIDSTLQDILKDARRR